jgi:hypothetical protein
MELDSCSHYNSLIHPSDFLPRLLWPAQRCSPSSDIALVDGVNDKDNWETPSVPVSVEK